MLRHVALVRTDISEEVSPSFIRVTRIGELGTTLPVTSKQRMLLRLLVTASVVPSTLILVTLMNEALRSSKTSVLTRATRCNMSEYAILLNQYLFVGVIGDETIYFCMATLCHDRMGFVINIIKIQFIIVKFLHPLTNKQTPWLLVSKRTILTDRPLLVGEF
jgi:hypothetical protein